MVTVEDLEAFEYFTPYEEKVKEVSPIMKMVREFSQTTQQQPSAALYKRLIEEEFKEWGFEETAYDSGVGNTELELKELADLVYVIYGYANVRGWDLDEAVERVHKNNLGRCIQEDGSILRRSDGKILKRKDYPKVDLNDLV